MAPLSWLFLATVIVGIGTLVRRHEYLPSHGYFTDEQAPAHESSNGIRRYPINSNEATGTGSERPVLLQGWDHRPDHWGLQELMLRVGHYPQYVKDLTVQPVTHARNINKEQCILPGTSVANYLSDHDILFFTNSKENGPFMKDLYSDYQTPSPVQHINGFEVFSAVGRLKSHPFHKHGESWLGQVEGRRMWWFLPPSAPKPERANACLYMTGEVPLPPGAVSCVQNPGEVVWFPKDWYHATCALDEWTVGIGAQNGRIIRQTFKALDADRTFTREEIRVTLKECLSVTTTIPKTTTTITPTTKSKVADSTTAKKDDKWKWFGGDLNSYYNSLEKDHNRDPTNPAKYAVHRWLGPSRSTEEQYKLLDTAVARHHDSSPLANLRVLDGGCGLGSGLMWMETHHPHWTLTGYTVSDEQYNFITNKLPEHQFRVHLKSYDDLDDGMEYDFIYSIEALIHSPDIKKTMEVWSNHLAPGGIIAVIDDYLSRGVDKNEEGIQDFAKSWLANSLVTVAELGTIGREFGLEVIENRDLDAEYRIIELNYRNKNTDIHPFGGRTHQAWMGSKWRQRLTFEGKVTYNLVLLQKPGRPPMTTTIITESKMADAAMTKKDLTECLVVPLKSNMEQGAEFSLITPQLMSGRGGNACISSWYCCNKGFEWYDNLAAHRTDTTDSLKLDRGLFGHYIDSFAKHLNEHYQNYPASAATGRFLDIGGTGSTASGMTKVTSQFQNFAGPLEYWKIDSDPAADSLQRTLYCDIDDCPQAETCGFDVTFSHSVLERAQRPWESFDTIARITKKGGLTMHLVPFSYQYHATPDDNYRFSHKALTTLLEDRGFDVLEVGYDICTKPETMLRRVDEHYDTIWLTYVIGRKR
jgi:cyclopropane fatty-acyl-phospholipid synthase-like methyltransferase